MTQRKAQWHGTKTSNGPARSSNWNPSNITKLTRVGTRQGFITKLHVVNDMHPTHCDTAGRSRPPGCPHPRSPTAATALLVTPVGQRPARIGKPGRAHASRRISVADIVRAASEATGT